MADPGCDLTGAELERYLKTSQARRQRYVNRHRGSIHERVAQAARDGSRVLVELLLSSFSEADRLEILLKQCKNGKLPLHHCLSRDHAAQLDCLKYMLTCVARESLHELLTAYSSMGYNALHMAATYNNAEAARLLLSSLSPDEQYAFITKPAGPQRQTVLEFPNISQEFRAGVQNFVISEVPASSLVQPPSEVIDDDILIAWPASLKGPSAVLGFCDSCHQHGNRKSQQGRNGASRRKRCAGADDLIFVNTSSALKHIDKFLRFVASSGSIKPFLKCRNAKGLTLLHLAAKDGLVEIIEKIFRAIESFSDKARWDLLAFQSNSGKTAAHYAAQYNRVESLRLLLYHAGDSDRRLLKMEDNQARTVGYYASSDVEKFLEVVTTCYWRTMVKAPTVLVFYNTFSGDAEWCRQDAEQEVHNVAKGFESQGIQPQVYRGFDGPLVAQEVRAACKKRGGVSALVVCIMSHGTSAAIYDKDKRPISADSLVSLICSHELTNTPKVLMIQSCRTEESRSALNRAHNRTIPNQRMDPARPSADNFQPRPVPQTTLNKHQSTPHLLIIHATLWGESALQNYFMRIFADELRKNVCRPPRYLSNIITRVNGQMEDQDVVFVNSLKRHVYLRDPLRVATIRERLQGLWQTMVQTLSRRFS